jgi:peptide deformylase
MLGVTRLAPSYLNITESVLRQKATELTEGSPLWEKLSEISTHMFEVMYAHDGAALAAPQVGLSIRVVVADPSNLSFGPEVLVNPRLSPLTEESILAEEGCLSIALRKGQVSRAKKVHVTYSRLDRTICELDAEGWLARVLQHEFDHLDGILYPDRMAPDVELEEALTSSVRRSEMAMKKIMKRLNR